MERHVTFLILKYSTTRREVFFSSVDNFQISKSTPDGNNQWRASESQMQNGQI